MDVAKAMGPLCGKQSKLFQDQEARPVANHRAVTRTTAEIAGWFGVARSTVYRVLQRAGNSE